jgi:hypothetical protein
MVNEAVERPRIYGVDELLPAFPPLLYIHPWRHHHLLSGPSSFFDNCGFSNE